MKDLTPNESNDVHVYECDPWNPELEAARLAGAPIHKLACTGCDAEISAYQITVDRCKVPGHHPVCKECMRYIRKEYKGPLKAAGYIRENKLVRLQ
jgi:hypothetical protein